MPFVFDLVDTQPGHVLPGAVAAEHGTVTAGAGAGTIIENYFGIASGDFHSDASVGGFVQADASATDRLAFNAGFAYMAMDLGEYTTWGFTVGARYNVVQRPSFRLAPFVAYAGWQWVGTYGTGLGVAMEGGGERFRWDLSLPLVGLMSDRLVDDCLACYEFQPYLPLFGEAGLSAALGDHDLLRLGTTSYAPNLSYQHVADSWFVASTLYVVPAYRFSEIVSVSGGVRL